MGRWSLAGARGHGVRAGRTVGGSRGQNGGRSGTGAGPAAGELRPAGRPRRCSGGGWGGSTGRPRSAVRVVLEARARGGSRARSTSAAPRTGRCRRWGPPARPAGSSAARTRDCRASRGAVVRSRPVGSVQVAVPSGARRTRQPGRLLDAVVSSAEGEQVGCGGGAGGPGSDVVEVAEPGGDRAAGEAAAAVAGADQGGELGAGPVGVGGEVVAGVEAGAGQRVARHERRAGVCLRPATDAVELFGRWSRSQPRRTSSGSDGRAPCTSTRSSS